MNKKGTIFLLMLIAVIYFMFGMLFYQFLKPDITSARTDLNCTTPDTAGDKATCLVLDGVIPVIVILILSTAFAYVTEKGLK